MKDGTISLSFGTDRVEFRPPERTRIRILSPRHAGALGDPVGELLSVLDGGKAGANSVGPSLESLCSGVERVLVVVSDRTRVTGVKVYLPLLTDFLMQCGLGETGIEILVSNGMHGPAGDGALGEFLPAEVLGRFRVSEHDCHRRDAHSYAGKTKRGTEVYLNKRVFEAELVVMTGSIGLHYFSGYRGGRKSILPGVASFETICANHRLTIPGGEGFHPLCRNGSLKGNPVHEDMLEALPMIPPSFLLNTITDASGSIVSVFAGDPVEAHLRGCDSFRKGAEVSVDERADCVIVSCGGYPRDVTLIQAHKAMENVSPALKKGGSMVVLAECRHGVGSETFMSWFEGNSLAHVRRKLVSNYVLHGHTALSLMEKLSRFKIYLVSALDNDVVASTGLVPVGSAEEALRQILSETSGELSTFVFPEGSETLPVLKASC
ncbi:MAG: nickel-dependent lactate racemase [Candidatus Eisenbacteria bacterium]|nr:nickel-dependent lactate racemase [Candidatus Eisenbacteria bacterium]